VDGDARGLRRRVNIRKRHARDFGKGLKGRDLVGRAGKL
jgi:hypothetical protein